MRVPISETEVRPQAPQAPEAQAPRPIEGAYGADVNLAQAGVGKAVSSFGDVLAQHAETQMRWNAQIQGYQGLDAYKATMQNHELADGEKTVVNNMGQKVTIPVGYLNRKGAFASGQLFPGNGVVDDFTRDSAKAKADILKTLSPMAQVHFLRQADAYEEGYRQKYIKYEAAQKEGYDIGTFNNQIKGKIGDAQAAMDPDSLKTVIDGGKGVEGLMTLNAKLGAYRQEPPETTAVNAQKHLLDAVTASAVSTLRNTGDLDKAQGQVDAFADRMNPGDSAKLQDTLNGMKHHLDQQQEYAAKAAQEKTDTDFALRQVSGDPAKMPTQKEIDDARVLGAANRPGGISEKMYAALKASNKPEAVTQEEKDDKISALADAHAAIANSAGTGIDTKARFDDIADYKMKLIDAYNAKAISSATFSKSLNVINKVYDKGLDGEVNKAYGHTDMISTFLDNAVRYMHGQGALEKSPEFKAAKAYVGKALMDRMNEGGVPDGQAQQVAQNILTQYIASKKPEVLGAKAVPNNTASKEGIMPLHTVQVASNSDRKIVAPKVPEPKQITPENLRHTAQVHNLTVEEVKKKLGIKEDGDGSTSS